MPYLASRGGHATGHLRDALHDCLLLLDTDDSPWYEPLEQEETLLFRDRRQQLRWEKMSGEQRGRWLIGQLWNCRDILPWLDCSALDLPHGSTYAQAARKLHAEYLNKAVAA